MLLRNPRPKTRKNDSNSGNDLIDPTPSRTGSPAQAETLDPRAPDDWNSHIVPPLIRSDERGLYPKKTSRLKTHRPSPNRTDESRMLDSTRQIPSCTGLQPIDGGNVKPWLVQLANFSVRRMFFHGDSTQGGDIDIVLKFAQLIESSLNSLNGVDPGPFVKASTRKLHWQRRVQVDTICKVDLVPDGAIARVLLAQPMILFAVRMHYPDQRLHIEEVDCWNQGQKSQISREPVANAWGVYSNFTQYKNHSVNQAQLCTMLDSRGWPKFILLNWRTSAFIDLGNGLNFALVLIPGYVVWTVYPPHEQQIVAVTALDQFSNYWQPLSDARRAQLSSGNPPIPNMMRERLAYNNHPLGSCSVGMHLTVTPNALYRGAYNISVQAGELSAPPTLIGKIGPDSGAVGRRKRKKRKSQKGKRERKRRERGRDLYFMLQFRSRRSYFYSLFLPVPKFHPKSEVD
ncbi:hypothetical protein C8R45DRAFT_1192696 [Mycena sanguinolenta]|nr:hypothetical protein C8R45DRAFT_1192696 [Mycena sanguinolenta]